MARTRNANAPMNPVLQGFFLFCLRETEDEHGEHHRVYGAQTQAFQRPSKADRYQVSKLNIQDNLILPSRLIYPSASGGPASPPLFR